MRALGWFAGTVAFVLWALPAWAGEPMPDEFSDPRLEAAAQAVHAAVNLQRSAQGTEPLIWSEFVAVVLREHLEDIFDKGWTGTGPAPAGVLPLDQRCARLHGVGAHIAPQYGARPAGAVDATAFVATLLATDAGKALVDPSIRLTAVAVRPLGDQWWICVAAVPGSPEASLKVQEVLAPFEAKAATGPPATRQAALRALGESKTSFVLPTLRTALRDADPATRIAAAEGLGHVVNRGSIPLLLHAAADPDAGVRTAAFAALGTLTNQTANGEALAAWTAWWAKVRPTLTMKPEFAVPVLREPLAVLLEQWTEAVKHRDTVRQVEILQAMRDHPEAGERDAIKLMLGALKSNTREVLFEACRAVAWNRLREAVSPLMALVKSNTGKDADAVKVALLALAQIGDLRALPLITDSPWSSKDREALWVRIHVTRYFRSAKSVDWLIGLITVADADKVAWFAKPIAGSLEHLTGETFGEDGRAWKDWWKKAKGRFRPEALPDDYKVEWLFDAPQKK